MITSLEQLDLKKKYTYADYLTWQFDEYVELFKGWIFPMSGPSRAHQKISRQLILAMGNFFNKNHCELYHAPFDVRLVKNKNGVTEKDIYTVVQPDLCVICDLEKLDDKGCFGSPEFIIEIISESNSTRDVKYKFDLYEENGVEEYWLVRPNEKTVQRFFLENEKYVFKGNFTVEDQVNSVLFPNLDINLSVIFKD